MSTTVLNEHDANQGAQSQGEFLGMTGNSGWYLLGSAGVSVMMVIILWGVLGVSLLLCVMVGAVLCLLSVAYVFTLKNNRPEHYDTDFFEAILIESGAIELSFGPRERTPVNPFAARSEDAFLPLEPAPARSRSNPTANGRGSGSLFSTSGIKAPGDERPDGAKPGARAKAQTDEVTVPLRVVESLQAELAFREEQLEEALSEREEN
jgi:hypothetical protein